MFMRVREVHLGVGRHSLEGRRSAAEILEVSAVRPALLAHGDVGTFGGLPTSQDMRFWVQLNGMLPNQLLQPIPRPKVFLVASWEFRGVVGVSAGRLSGVVRPVGTDLRYQHSTLRNFAMRIKRCSCAACDDVLFVDNNRG